jgi:ankyrin repeat protein
LELIRDEEIFKKSLRNMTREEKTEEETKLKDRFKILKGESENLTLVAEMEKNKRSWNNLIQLKDKFFATEFTEWVLKHYKNNNINFVEDIESRLKKAIDDFKWLERRKEVEYRIIDLDGLHQLEDVLSQYNELLEEKDREEIEERGSREGGNILYDGAQIKIIEPTTVAGACYYGKGTRWCTASTIGRNMFNDYKRMGPLYIIQPKKPGRNGKEKYQLHFESNQFRDENDRNISLGELYKQYDEIGELSRYTNIYYIILLDLINNYTESSNYLAKKILQKKGIDVNIQDKFGQTALHWAIIRNNKEIVKLLLGKENIDVNIQNKNGKTALYWAIKNNNTEIVKLLLEKEDIDVNIQYENGKTALYWAIYNKNTEIVKLLLEKEDIDVNIQNKNGESALLWAIYNENTEIVKLLLEKEDIDVNIQYENGDTPIHLAISKKRLDIIKLLLKKAGLNLYLRNKRDKTPQSLIVDDKSYPERYNLLRLIFYINLV